MYQFKNIPQELKNAPQWILWRSEERDGKKTKVPYQIDGSMAQSSNKRTWSTFPTVLKFYNDRDYDGIGFMFSKDDPFIGIDIDHCVEDGVLSPFAEEIVQAISSYTEYSPSGKGVHIITKVRSHCAGRAQGEKILNLGWKYTATAAILPLPVTVSESGPLKNERTSSKSCSKNI